MTLSPKRQSPLPIRREKKCKMSLSGKHCFVEDDEKLLVFCRYCGVVDDSYVPVAQVSVFVEGSWTPWQTAHSLDDEVEGAKGKKAHDMKVRTIMEKTK